MKSTHFEFSGKPVPIIELRVTNSANCSSFIFSVPSGLIGKTKYLNSAVESQTLISIFGSIFNPNSERTFLGSLTVLDLYSSLLYHVGGMPKTGQG